MRESDQKSVGATPAINCLEVIIPRMYLDNNVDNIFWTLSVYSLENAPVQSSKNQDDVFHFMVYDWKRTIEKLLKRHQIPFSIVQYFTFDNISSAYEINYSDFEFSHLKYFYVFVIVKSFCLNISRFTYARWSPPVIRPATEMMQWLTCDEALTFKKKLCGSCDFKSER